jgi:DNA-3-methyladenine glycosylase I
MQRAKGIAHLTDIHKAGTGGITIMGYCTWAGMNEANRIYHDTEWGIPVHDDRQMFEHLTLECFQCGLSWDLMLKKREIFRLCFDNFDYDKIAEYDEADVTRILNTEGMIKSPQKVRAVINNARCCQKLRSEYGSLCNYFWSFSKGRTILYQGHDTGTIPVSNGLSEMISRDMKKHGFKYVGAVTIYSHLQACGVINDHDRDCPCCSRINDAHPTVRKRRDHEVN